MPSLYKSARSNELEVLSRSLLNRDVDSRLIAILTHVFQNVYYHVPKARKDELLQTLEALGDRYKTVTPEALAAVKNVRDKFESPPSQYGA